MSLISWTAKSWNKTKVPALRKVFIHCEGNEMFFVQTDHSLSTHLFFLFIEKIQRALIDFFAFQSSSTEDLIRTCLISISIVASFGFLLRILHQCLSTIDGIEPNRYPSKTVFEAWMGLMLSWISFLSIMSLNSMDMKVTVKQLWAMQRLILVGIPYFSQSLSDNNFAVGRLKITTELCSTS